MPDRGDQSATALEQGQLNAVAQELRAEFGAYFQRFDGHTPMIVLPDRVVFGGKHNFVSFSGMGTGRLSVTRFIGGESMHYTTMERDEDGNKERLTHAFVEGEFFQGVVNPSGHAVISVKDGMVVGKTMKGFVSFSSGRWTVEGNKVKFATTSGGLQSDNSEAVSGVRYMFSQHHPHR